ncbi:unnamed protein product [Vitrella brassicaformis CCMP3155]|uniref:L-fucokinase domain-containing protein n=2 Tax=Vitrella brassicaformis TaxID=1169539 RepID=A0A0G4EMB4_VITBC|nr:unnamed protein product [Vitrella brassicaformis CCMP3155]|eukprot:CEL98093.1 unnamed protein product [Vitrella brassicaformis CCMP3155]
MSRCFPFTSLIVTAANDAQASAFEREVAFRRATGSIPPSCKTHVISDPKGARIGSGGATLNALVRCAPGGPPADELLLIIHSGGDSQRSPVQSVCGKAFATLNCQQQGGTGPFLSAPFDLLLESLCRLFAGVKKGGLVVSCSDVVLAVPHADEGMWGGSGVVGVAAEVDARYGPRHGVYVPTTEGRVAQFLQKPTEAVMTSEGASLPPGKIAVDTGVVYFDTTTTQRLVEMAQSPVLAGCTEAGLKEGQPPLRTELYSDIMLALSGASTDQEGYLRHDGGSPPEALVRAREMLWKELQTVGFSVAMPSEMDFLHLGTTKELMDFMCGAKASFTAAHSLRPVVASYLPPFHPLTRPPPLPTQTHPWTVVSNSILLPVDSSGASDVAGCLSGAVIEHSVLEGRYHVGHRAFVSGVRSGYRDGLCVGDEMVVQETAVGGGMHVVAVYCLGDDIKRPAADQQATVCGVPWETLYDAAQVTADDIWPSDVAASKRTLWTARLFPPFPAASPQARRPLSLWLMQLRDKRATITSDDRLAGVIQEWRRAHRLSLKDILRQADASQEFHWRKNELPRLITEAHKATSISLPAIQTDPATAALSIAAGPSPQLDIVCLVASTDDKAKALEGTLHKAQQRGRLPAGAEIMTVVDPCGGGQCGSDRSGSIVLNALLVIAEKLSGRNSATYLDLDVLCGLRIVVIYVEDGSPLPPFTTLLPLVSGDLQKWPLSSLDVTLGSLVPLAASMRPGVLACSAHTIVQGSIAQLHTASDSDGEIVVFASRSRDEERSDTGLLHVDVATRDVVGMGGGGDGGESTSSSGSTVVLPIGLIDFDTRAAQMFLALHTTSPLDRCTYLGVDTGSTSPLPLSLTTHLLPSLIQPPLHKQEGPSLPLPLPSSSPPHSSTESSPHLRAATGGGTSFTGQGSGSDVELEGDMGQMKPPCRRTPQPQQLHMGTGGQAVAADEERMVEVMRRELGGKIAVRAAIVELTGQGPRDSDRGQIRPCVALRTVPEYVKYVNSDLVHSTPPATRRSDAAHSHVAHTVSVVTPWSTSLQSPPTKPLLVNSCLQGKGFLHPSCVAVNCRLDGEFSLGEGAVCVGVRSVKGISVAANVVVQEIEMRTGADGGSPRSPVVVFYGIQDDLRAAFRDPSATFRNRPWSDLFTSTAITPTDLWPPPHDDTQQQQCTLANAKLFPIHAPSLSPPLWLMQMHGPPAAGAGRAQMMSAELLYAVDEWRRAKRVSLEEAVMAMDVCAEMRKVDDVGWEVDRHRMEAVLTGRMDDDLTEVYTACAADGRKGVFAALDSIMTASVSELDVLCRALIHTSEALAAFATQEGGVRSGPAHHPEWAEAMAGLRDVNQVDAVRRSLRDMAAVRDRWMHTGRPDLLIRSARHYESAAFLVIQQAVATCNRFVHFSLSPTARLPLHVWAQAVAPARLDLGGGWSDTPPMSYEYGGKVTTVAIKVDGEKPIGARACRTEQLEVVLAPQSGGRDTADKAVCLCRSLEDLCDYNKPGAPCALLKAALVCCRIIDPHDSSRSLQQQLQDTVGGGLRIESWAHLPVGSGLGTSSILAGVVLAAVGVACGRPYSDTSSVCHAVLMVEQMMTTGGGWQDQVGGLNGGARLGQSGKGLPLRVEATAIPLEPAVVDRLNRHLLLIYTGRSRLAKCILQQVVRRWSLRGRPTLTDMESNHQYATTAAEALRKGDLQALGGVMCAYWELKRRMAVDAEPPIVTLLNDTMRPHSHGMTLAGAGGGGFWVGVTKQDKQTTLEAVSQQLGLSGAHEGAADGVSLAKRGSAEDMGEQLVLPGGETVFVRDVEVDTEGMVITVEGRRDKGSAAGCVA